MKSRIFIPIALLVFQILLWTVGSYANTDNLMIVQVEDSVKEPPPSGTLVLPDSGSPATETEKKCMTVCARWGEDCTYINRGTGGTTRSCRRTCQQFTEECF